MSTGPIEFIREPSRDDKGPTEYGGVAGLVQPEVVAGMPGHIPTASEVRGMLVRAQPASVETEQEIPGKDGVPIVRVGVQVDPAGNPIDPATGRVLNMSELGVEDAGPGGGIEGPPPTEKP